MSAFVRDPNALGLDSMMSVTGAKLHTYRWQPPADRQLMSVSTKEKTFFFFPTFSDRFRSLSPVALCFMRMAYSTRHRDTTNSCIEHLSHVDSPFMHLTLSATAVQAASAANGPIVR